MQREGIDFDELYAPVSKHATLRALLAKAADEDLELYQLDIKTAFLYGELEEEVYIKQAPGYEEGPPGTVGRLHRALYGLRQAPRMWHARMEKELLLHGFTKSASDPGLYLQHNKDHTVYALVWVDDVLLASRELEAAKKVAAALSEAFKVHVIGEPEKFLGMKIDRDREAGTIKLSQGKYIKDMVTKYGMTDAKPKSVPLPPNTKLTRQDDSELLDTTKYGYSELVGSLLYASVCTRPDISQSVGALAKFMSKPTVNHYAAAKSVLRYLASTPEFGITYGGGGRQGLTAYCDADYAGDLDSRKSTTAYVFILNGGVISWSSRLQPTVAASTTEAEYMAAAYAVKEALWLRKLMQDLSIPAETVSIYCDNQSAIALLNNPITSARSKHIDVLHHFARERVARGEVEFRYCATACMIADCLTKPVPEHKLVFCREGMGISP
jgi:hypothetical protein